MGNSKELQALFTAIGQTATGLPGSVGKALGAGGINTSQSIIEHEVRKEIEKEEAKKKKGILGGNIGAGIAGLALAPFTGGASIPAAVAIGAGGGALGSGAGQLIGGGDVDFGQIGSSALLGGLGGATSSFLGAGAGAPLIEGTTAAATATPAEIAAQGLLPASAAAGAPGVAASTIPGAATGAVETLKGAAGGIGTAITETGHGIVRSAKDAVGSVKDFAATPIQSTKGAITKAGRDLAGNVSDFKSAPIQSIQDAFVADISKGEGGILGGITKDIASNLTAPKMPSVDTRFLLPERADAIRRDVQNAFALELQQGSASRAEARADRGLDLQEQRLAQSSGSKPQLIKDAVFTLDDGSLVQGPGVFDAETGSITQAGGAASFRPVAESKRDVRQGPGGSVFEITPEGEVRTIQEATETPASLQTINTASGIQTFNPKTGEFQATSFNAPRPASTPKAFDTSTVTLSDNSKMNVTPQGQQMLVAGATADDVVAAGQGFRGAPAPAEEPAPGVGDRIRDGRLEILDSDGNVTATKSLTTSQISTRRRDNNEQFARSFINLGYGKDVNPKQEGIEAIMASQLGGVDGARFTEIHRQVTKGMLFAWQKAGAEGSIRPTQLQDEAGSLGYRFDVDYTEFDDEGNATFSSVPVVDENGEYIMLAVPTAQEEAVAP